MPLLFLITKVVTANYTELRKYKFKIKMKNTHNPSSQTSSTVDTIQILYFAHL